MKKELTLIYDGTFNGFLTAVYIAFDEHITIQNIEANSFAQKELFGNTKTILTNTHKAKAVWDGLQTKSYHLTTIIYFAF